MKKNMRQKLQNERSEQINFWVDNDSAYNDQEDFYRKYKKIKRKKPIHKKWED